MSLPKIPLADLPEPQPYTKVLLGFVYAFEVTIPVTVTTNPAGTTVTLNREADNLGSLLRDISQALSQEQVNDLVAGKQVKL